MNNSRELILNKLRKNQSQTAQKNIQNYLLAHSRGPVPKLKDTLLKQFINKVEAVSGTVKCINNEQDIPIAINEYISSEAIPANFVAANNKTLKQLHWDDSFNIEYRAASSNDITSLSVAYAGIAETGSLVLCSSAESATTLNFLPDNFICVIRRNEIFQSMEDIWDLLRSDIKQNKLKEIPRSINFITGPSRTADVEQTIQLGAHGPRRLHVIILENN